jgi:hypothetical protein
MPTKTFATREQWLREAARRMSKWVNSALKTLDGDTGLKHSYPQDTLISVGWPKGGRGANDAIGQCWQPGAHVGETTRRTIFISPELDEPVRVVDVLLHEMAHAALPPGTGHRAPFVRLVRELGLAGKATATYAEKGSELYGKLEALCKALGPYPHHALKRQAASEGGRKRSQWVRCRSESQPGYRASVKLDSLMDYGMPRGPDGRPLVASDPAALLLALAERGFTSADRSWFPGTFTAGL